MTVAGRLPKARCGTYKGPDAYAKGGPVRVLALGDFVDNTCTTPAPTPEAMELATAILRELGASLEKVTGPLAIDPHTSEVIPVHGAHVPTYKPAPAPSEERKG